MYTLSRLVLDIKSGHDCDHLVQRASERVLSALLPCGDEYRIVVREMVGREWKESIVCPLYVLQLTNWIIYRVRLGPIYFIMRGDIEEVRREIESRYLLEGKRGVSVKLITPQEDDKIEAIKKRSKRANEDEINRVHENKINTQLEDA